MRTRLIAIAGVALTALVLIGSACANLIFEIGPNVNSGVGVSNLQCCVAGTPTTAAPPTVLTGFVQGRPDVGLQLKSDENTISATAGGSTISSVPANRITNIAIVPCFAASCFGFGVVRFTLPKAQANDVTIDAFNCLPGSGPGGTCGESKSFVVNGLGPAPGTKEEDINLSITATSGVIWNLTITSPAGFQELKNVRFSNAPVPLPEKPPDPGGTTVEPPTVVPEPSSLLMGGSGVLVLTQVLRRKLKHGFGTRSA